MRVWLVAIMLCAPACNQVFGLDGSARVGTCHDNFDGDGDPCGTWGSPYGKGGTVFRDGVLNVRPAPMTIGNSTGCSANGDVTFDAGVGVKAEILQVVGASGFTALEVDSKEASAGLEMSVSSGRLSLYVTTDFNNEIASKLYDPKAMRWWRLRPDPGRTHMLAETSPDATTWTSLFMYTPPTGVPAKVSPTVGAGTSDPEANPGNAQFGQLDLCP